MSADTSDLTKVDSAIGGVAGSPPKDAKETKRRTTSSAPGVMNINDLGKYLLLSNSTLANSLLQEKEGVKIKIAPETQKSGW